MPDQQGFVRSALRRVVLTTAPFWITGCSVFAFGSPPGVKRFLAPLPSEYGPGAPTVDSAAVELRGFAFSPHLEILTWTTDETSVGLRARLRRDGTLVRDHRLYVSTYMSVAAGSRFDLALAPTRQLKLTGVSRDDRACAGGACLPMETFGVQIPDDLLRANRDSLPVRFYAHDGHEVLVTLHRDLINVYLATFDSITASLRRK